MSGQKSVLLMMLLLLSQFCSQTCTPMLQKVPGTQPNSENKYLQEVNQLDSAQMATQSRNHKFIKRQGGTGDGVGGRDKSSPDEEGLSERKRLRNKNISSVIELCAFQQDFCGCFCSDVFKNK